MGRRRATPILIAILAFADLAGAALLRDAWNECHNKAASVAAPVVHAKQAVPVQVGDASAVHAGP